MPNALARRNVRPGPLAERPFRILWAGQAVSALGNQVVPIALAFAVLDLTGSASDLGLVLAAAFVPRLLFLLVGGVWADRLPRTRVMLTADAVRCASQAVIALQLFAGSAQIWQLAVLGAVEGAAGAFFMPAAAAVVPEVVSRDQLQAANALMSVARNAAGVVGPALGGLLVALVGAGSAFALDAATFAISAVSLGMLRVPLRTVVRESFTSELRGGLGELLAHRWYWSNVISHCIWNAMMSAFFVLGPFVAARSLGGAGAWGAIMVAGAIGSLAAGALAIHARPRRPLVVANLALSLAALPLVALAGPLSVAAIAATTAAAMGGLAYMSAIWETTVQREIPEETLSRVMAWDWLASLVIAPASRALVGPLAVVIGARATLTTAGLVIAGSSLGILLVPAVRGLRGPAVEVLHEPVPERETALV
jgi:MFS family permease